MKLQEEVAGNEREILCAGLPHLMGCTFFQRLSPAFYSYSSGC